MNQAIEGKDLLKWSLIWLVVAIVILAAMLKAEDRTQMLWNHVYKPERLIVRKLNAAVTGTVVDATHGKRKDGVRHEADGDCHGWLKLDAGQEQYLNAGNMSDEEGNLVYEIVCLFPVTQQDAKSSCRGYKSDVKLAPIGAHVRMNGSWVQDSNHAKWLELHPVSSIEVLK